MGGDFWDKTDLPTGNMKFFCEDRLVYIFSYNGAIRSTDYGTTWTADQGVLFDDISFPSDSVGYSIFPDSDTTKLLLGKTTNGGKSWSYSSILATKPPNRMFRGRALTFRDDENGFVTVTTGRTDGSGTVSGLYFTSDGGKTWTPHPGPASFVMLLLHDKTWLGSHITGAILKSYNDFDTNSPGRQVDNHNLFQKIIFAYHRTGCPK